MIALPIFIISLWMSFLKPKDNYIIKQKQPSEFKNRTCSVAFCMFMLFTAAFSHRVKGRSAIISSVVRREKLIDGEVNSFECIARIFCVTTTFFGGNTEVVCGNKHLYISLQLDNCEYSQCYLDSLFATEICEASFEATANVCRKAIAIITDGVAAIAYSANLSIEDYRLHTLYLCFGVGVAHLVVVLTTICNIGGGEYFYISFTAVKNAFFIKGDKPVKKHGRGGGAGVGFKDNLYKECKLYRIKSDRSHVVL